MKLIVVALLTMLMTTGTEDLWPRAYFESRELRLSLLDENGQEVVIFRHRGMGRTGAASPMIYGDVMLYVAYSRNPTGSRTIYSIRSVDIHGEDVYRGPREATLVYGRAYRTLHTTDDIPYDLEISHVLDGYLYFYLTPKAGGVGGPMAGMHRVRLCDTDAPDETVRAVAVFADPGGSGRISAEMSVESKERLMFLMFYHPATFETISDISPEAFHSYVNFYNADGVKWTVWFTGGFARFLFGTFGDAFTEAQPEQYPNEMFLWRWSWALRDAEDIVSEILEILDRYEQIATPPGEPFNQPPLLSP